MNTLTRDKLVKILCEEIGINQREAKEIVYSFFELIKSNLLAGKNVKLTGLGLFKLIDKGSRPGRDLSKNLAIPIEPRRVVTFKSGVVLKEKIEMSQLQPIETKLAETIRPQMLRTKIKVDEDAELCKELIKA